MENIEGRKAEFEEKKAELKQEGQQIRREARDALRTIGEDASHWTAVAMKDFSQAVRKTAEELEHRSYSRTAPAIRAAADGIERAGQSLESADMSQLLQNASSFAKRNPQAFIGATMLAGFAAGRFFRSSSKSFSRTQTAMSDTKPGTYAAGQTDSYEGGYSGGTPGPSFGGTSFGGISGGTSPGASGIIPPIS